MHDPLRKSILELHFIRWFFIYVNALSPIVKVRLHPGNNAPSTEMSITAQIFASSILIYQGVHHCCLLCDIGFMAGLLLLALPGELLTCNIKIQKHRLNTWLKLNGLNPHNQGLGKAYWKQCFCKKYFVMETVIWPEYITSFPPNPCIVLVLCCTLLHSMDRILRRGMGC